MPIPNSQPEDDSSDEDEEQFEEDLASAAEDVAADEEQYDSEEEPPEEYKEIDEEFYTESADLPPAVEDANVEMPYDENDANENNEKFEINIISKPEKQLKSALKTGTKEKSSVEFTQDTTQFDLPFERIRGKNKTKIDLYSEEKVAGRKVEISDPEENESALDAWQAAMEEKLKARTAETVTPVTPPIDEATPDAAEEYESPLDAWKAAMEAQLKARAEKAKAELKAETVTPEIPPIENLQTTTVQPEEKIEPEQPKPIANESPDSQIIDEAERAKKSKHLLFKSRFSIMAKLDDDSYKNASSITQLRNYLVKYEAAPKDKADLMFEQIKFELTNEINRLENIPGKTREITAITHVLDQIKTLQTLDIGVLEKLRQLNAILQNEKVDTIPYLKQHHHDINSCYEQIKKEIIKQGKQFEKDNSFKPITISKTLDLTATTHMLSHCKARQNYHKESMDFHVIIDNEYQRNLKQDKAYGQAIEVFNEIIKFQTHKSSLPKEPLALLGLIHQALKDDKENKKPLPDEVRQTLNNFSNVIINELYPEKGFFEKRQIHQNLAAAPEKPVEENAVKHRM